MANEHETMTGTEYVNWLATGGPTIRDQADRIFELEAENARLKAWQMAAWNQLVAHLSPELHCNVTACLHLIKTAEPAVTGNPR